MRKKVELGGPRGKRSGDVRKNLTPEQLRGIGEVTMAYNEAEFLIDLCFGLGLQIEAGLWFEVSTRINGVDGLIAIIKKLVARDCEIDAATYALIENAFAAFKECKTYRDAVIHARILDAPSGLGEFVRKQGTHYHVLLTVEALNALYDRLVAVRTELVDVCCVIACVFWASDLLRPLRAADEKLKVAQQAQEHAALLRLHQTERLSLPPLPTIPEELQALPTRAEPSPNPAAAADTAGQGGESSFTPKP
ncbi:MAG: hypothetical protein ACT4OG_02220 [Alphaproteobacteria bacterium]